MLKIFYISAWVSLAAAVFVSLLTGSLNSVALFVFSLIALALVLSLAMWSVITQTRDFKTE